MSCSHAQGPGRHEKAMEYEANFGIPVLVQGYVFYISQQPTTSCDVARTTQYHRWMWNMMTLSQQLTQYLIWKIFKGSALIDDFLESEIALSDLQSLHIRLPFIWQVTPGPGAYTPLKALLLHHWDIHTAICVDVLVCGSQKDVACLVKRCDGSWCKWDGNPQISSIDGCWEGECILPFRISGRGGKKHGRPKDLSTILALLAKHLNRHVDVEFTAFFPNLLYVVKPYFATRLEV